MMTNKELAAEIEKGLQETGTEKPGPGKTAELYMEWLRDVPTMTDERCFIYAGMWCTFSQLLVANFLTKAQEHGKNINSLHQLYWLFAKDFAAEILLDNRQDEFEKRARKFLQYIGDLDLTDYGVPEYDKAEEWI